MNVYSKSDIDAMEEMYVGNHDLTVGDIAKYFGKDRATVGRILRERGVEIRRGQGPSRKLSEDQESQLVRAYRSGDPITDIQERFNIGKTALFKILKRHKVETERAVALRQAEEILGSTTKECTKCQKLLPLDAFGIARGGYRGGLNSQCKLCRKGYREETKVERAGKGIRLRMRNRQFVWDYYKTQKCAHCGEDDPVVLESHHIDQDTKEKNVSALANSTCSIKRIKRELEKCETICANCHRRQTAKEQGWYQWVSNQPDGD